MTRLVAALDGHVFDEASEVDQPITGAENVRTEIKENRKLSPAETADVVACYEAGASIRSLGQQFGLHEQTVRAHLKRQGVALRPVLALTETQEVEVVRLYVEETWTIAELAVKFGVGEGATRSVLVRRGVARRAQVRRKKDQ